MRKVATIAICATLSLCHVAQAKSDTISAPRMTTASLSSITAVAVVGLEALPKEAQDQVFAASTRISDNQLRALRKSIKLLPGAYEALNARNLEASDVLVAVTDGQGRLLLITAIAV
jgi:hypothetical protein